MNLFDYIRPASVTEAVAAASEPGAAYLAGGTNLLDMMKTGAMRPGKLVDITRMPGLDRIETLPDGAMRIGAMVRNADLARDAGFASAYPAVAEALLSGASAQLRNAAASAAISCSARALPISRIRAAPATGVSPAPAAMRSRAKTAPSGSRLVRRLHRQPRVGLLRAARGARCHGRDRRHGRPRRLRWRISTCFPARRRSARPCWNRET